jgi:hypothetical protein
MQNKTLERSKTYDRVRNLTALYAGEGLPLLAPSNFQA